MIMIMIMIMIIIIRRSCCWGFSQGVISAALKMMIMIIVSIRMIQMIMIIKMIMIMIMMIMIMIIINSTKLKTSLGWNHSDYGKGPEEEQKETLSGRNKRTRNYFLTIIDNCFSAFNNFSSTLRPARK